MTEKCIYPDCNCPFDMGVDNKCLRGFERLNEAATTPEADVVGLSATNDLLCCPFCGSDDVSSGEVMGKHNDGEFFKQTGCLNCGAAGPESKSKHDVDADAEWNRRTGTKLTEKMIDAPRMVIMFLSFNNGHTLQGLRKHLTCAGVDYSSWPEWAKTETGHLDKATAAELIYTMMADAT